MMTMEPNTATPCEAAPTTGGLERTRFFARQLVTPDDLTQDQIYFREKNRRHNRMLHGWGVVCGACVRRGRGDCEVIVEPGYILGPYGDEIVIDRDVTFDLCKQGLRERDGCCGEELDPWCGDVRSECPDGTLYLAVRYSECRARPVRSAGGGCGCGCDDSACEYTRIRDSFTLKVLRELPSSYTTPMQQPSIASLIPCMRERTARRCPPCPRDPWVILADIAVGRDCRVRGVDCFAHRRYVASFADFFFTCRPGATAPVGGIAPIAGNVMLSRAMSALMGTTNLVDVRMAVSDIPPRATVTLSREDGSTVTLPAYFEVQPGESVADLLEREGDRELYDPASDRTITLREIYRGANVPMNAKLESTTSALAPLEGRVLRTPAAPAPEGGGAGPGALSRADLTTLLDARALERLDTEHGGDVAKVADFKATDLAPVAESSDLGKKIDALTVADVSNMSRDEFIKLATTRVSRRRAQELEQHAIAVWNAARKITGRGDM
jgi:hypothetical protein